MGEIHRLNPQTINQIAAGEVVEASHSVLKELVENSLDAESTEIIVHTELGGLDSIIIRDNGKGILKEDLPLVLERHATSKISSLIDLYSIQSYGFRGEALASIASVSNLRIASGRKKERFAYEIKLENGNLEGPNEIPAFQGTIVEVKNLFYNTPVRRKFLKSIEQEDKKIKNRFQICALSRPTVAFKLIQNQKEVISTKPGELIDRIIDLFGENFRENLIPIYKEKNGITLQGYVSNSSLFKSNRTGQYFFVNYRPVEYKNLSFYLKKAYDELLATNSHPFCFLYLNIPPNRIDVNVHPQKKEIRFLEEDWLSYFLLQTFKEVVQPNRPVGFFEVASRSSISKPTVYENRNNNLSEFLYSNESINLISEQKGFPLNERGPGIKIEELNSNPEKNNQFQFKKHFGILFETFIVAEGEDGLYIIDQHTAHERIRYEEVLLQLRKKNYQIQPLLTPIKLQISKEDIEEIIKHSLELEGLGISLEEFGEDCLIVREVPSYFVAGKEQEILLDFIHHILFTPQERWEPYDFMAKCVACRSSIRKGTQLSNELIAEVLNRLSYTSQPARCPHGRPTLIRITREDLEKMFFRK